MLRLQEAGAHNINLVTAASYVLLVVEALDIAQAQGLRLPVAYNTNAYEKVETLRLLAGYVDTYLPDLKYASEETARRLSGTPDYFAVVTAAICEILRQVGGAPVFDSAGLIERGLIARHLVLPGHLPETQAVPPGFATICRAPCRLVSWPGTCRITRLSTFQRSTPPHRRRIQPGPGRLLRLGVGTRLGTRAFHCGR